MNHKPQLKTPLLYTVTAGVFWIASGYSEPRLLTGILYVCTFAAGWGALFSGLDYLTYTTARRWADFKTAMFAGEIALTEKQIAWNNSCAAMDSEHLAYAARLRPSIKYIPGHHTPPLEFLLLGDGLEVPMPFIREFFELSAGKFLVERRRWSEGSAQHKWADAFTLTLLKADYATDAAGNQPARWMSEQAHEDALYSYGVLKE